ncbi:MAG: hypothetical protein JOY93_06835 [Acidobacteriales bacterium]|nr:hypothetical protein [Terriglobales bacterium]
MPKNFYVGGGVADTVISVAAAIFLGLAIAGMLFLPRRYATALALSAALLIPASNTLVVAGDHLSPARIIAVFGIFRLIRFKLTGSGPLLAGGVTSLDWVVFGWAIVHAAAITLLWSSWAAAVNQCGFLLGTLGIYCLFRHLVRDGKDIRNVVRVLAIVVAINAPEMIYEQITGHNLFSLLGGLAISGVRDGHVRAQGAFQHPLLAGAFAGMVLPLFFWLWKSGRDKTLAVAGMLGSCLMISTTWSSTPVFVLAAAIGALCFWPFRRRMRIFRWGLVITLISLHLVMKAPVWFLIQRVELGASSGYHRAILVDHFVKHFWDWWLIGSKEMSTWDYETWDTSNEFVNQGETAGLLTLIFFLAILWRGFQKLGRKTVRAFPQREWLLWSLGAALFANIIAFFGVSYWDQTQVAWFALLSLIAVAGVIHRRGVAIRKADVWPVVESPQPVIS